MRYLIVFLCCALSSTSYAFESLAGKFHQDPGVLMFESFQYDDAERYFQNNLSDQSELYELSLLYLTKLSVLRNDGQKAVDFIEKSLAIEPNSVEEMILAGDAYCTNAMQVSIFRALRSGRRCGQWYTQAAEEHPENVRALRTAIQFHIEAPSIAGGSMKQAEAFLDQLAQVSEEDARIIKVLLVNSQEGTQQALAAANRLSSKPYSNPRTAYDFAIFFKEQERFEEAQELLQEVIAAGSNGTDSRYYNNALFQLGEILIANETTIDEGIALIERYVETSNDAYGRYYFWSRLRLAKAYGEVGKNQQHKDLLAFIQNKSYSHDSRFKQALDAYMSH